MTQSGDPLENSLAERVNGIFKDELLNKQNRNFQEAQHAIAIAISVYNTYGLTAALTCSRLLKHTCETAN